jgi:hypothetical protein
MARGASVLSGRNRVATLFALLAFCALALAAASSASALTIGVGWSGNKGQNTAEMGVIGKSGAATFRVPLGGPGNEKENEEMFAAAAANGVTIHAEVSAGKSSLPSGPARTEFFEEVEGKVKNYGYSGEFWEKHPSLPYKPVTTWEVGNEPNLNGIPAEEYGQFLGEAANAIQSASKARSGKGTEVLFAGIYAWGNQSALANAVTYLAQAYTKFKTNGNVTGVAIHPYELDPETFFEPKKGTHYNRIEAFKYAVFAFHSKLVELAESAGSAEKSLWITEFGWPVGSPEYAISAADQATLLKEAVQYAQTNQSALNLKDIVWYDYRDNPKPENWADYCGLRPAGAGYRLSWDAFQEVTGATKWPTAPTVQTLPATGVSATQATLNSTVNPQGLPTTYQFEYGLTESYGSLAPVTAGEAGEGLSAVERSTTLQGLRPNTTYYYRVVSSNTRGTSTGGGSSFKTPPVVAYQGGAGELWSAGVPAGATNLNLGMGSAGSRPAITALSSGGYEAAIRSSADELWTYSSSGGATNLKLGMKSGSTPSIAALPSGGYVIAFQSNEGELWLYSSFGGAVNTHLGMGTTASSPSISTYSSGQYVVAFRAFGNGLWTYSSTSGAKNLEQTLYAGSNPAVTTFSSGAYQVAYQSSAGELNTYSSSTATNTNLGLGMGFEASTPSIATLSGGAWAIAFRAGSGELWTYSSTSGSTNTHLGMGATATTPSIAASGSSYQVAFKAFGEELWSYAPGVGGSSTGLAMRAGSSPALAAG